MTATAEWGKQHKNELILNYPGEFVAYNGNGLLAHGVSRQKVRDAINTLDETTREATVLERIIPPKEDLRGGFILKRVFH